jgi:hypothetical protein
MLIYFNFKWMTVWKSASTYGLWMLLAPAQMSRYWKIFFSCNHHFCGNLSNNRTIQRKLDGQELSIAEHYHNEASINFVWINNSTNWVYWEACTHKFKHSSINVFIYTKKGIKLMKFLYVELCHGTSAALSDISHWLHILSHFYF